MNMKSTFVGIVSIGCLIGARRIFAECWRGTGR